MLRPPPLVPGPPPVVAHQEHAHEVDGNAGRGHARHDVVGGPGADDALVVSVEAGDLLGPAPAGGVGAGGGADGGTLVLAVHAVDGAVADLEKNTVNLIRLSFEVFICSGLGYGSGLGLFIN